MHCVGFHEQCITHVFLIGQNASDRRYRPLARSGWRWNTAFRKDICDVADGVAVHGVPLAMTGKVGNWYQIDYNGSTAYIIEDYVVVTVLPE